MKKFLKIVSASVLLAGSLFANNLSKDEISQIQSLPIVMGSGLQIQKAYKDGEFILLRGSVQGQMQELAMTADKKYLIAGKVYDTKSGQTLSIPNDVSILKGKEGLTYGTGKEVYYLFTDPECPYCKKFESYFEEIKDKVQLKIFFYPLAFHENARPMTKYILDNKTNEDKIVDMMTVDITSDDYKNKKYSKDTEAKLDAIIDEHMKFASEFGVRGTPALFDTEGKAVSWVGLLQKFGITVQ